MNGMSRVRPLLARFRALITRGNADGEFDEEIAAHLSLLSERYMREGMTPAQATLAAKRQFGNTTLVQENRRMMQSFMSLELLGRDGRLALRQLRRSPVFTLTAMLSLALGIGANTAVFTLLDQLVLRVLPVSEPERLVMIWARGPHLGANEGDRAASYPMYQDFQREAKAFESVFCRYGTSLTFSVDGTTERVDAELVSGNYFQALRVGPAVGRVFSPEMDDRVYRGHPSVVLSHDYWISRFNGDAGIVGKKIRVNNYPMEVVGVSAPGFVGVDPSSSPRIRVPILMKPLMTPERDDLANRRSQWIHMFARLRPGYTVESARASVEPLFHRILRQEVQEPPLRGISSYHRERFLRRTALVEPAAHGYSELRQRYSTALIVLMGMAGLILLIACSNVANLLIARAVSRQKEIAVRLAIGAARRTLVRYLLVESIMLSFIGAALGVLLSTVATGALLRLLPDSRETLVLKPEPDLRILVFSIVVACCTAILFGLAPALQGTRLDLWTTLKNASGAVAGPSGATRLRKLLVVVQVGLSFLLLAGAGLFARTLMNLKNTDTGLKDISSLVTFQVDPGKNGYGLPRIRRLHEEILQAIRATPGVESAAFTVLPLLQGWGSDVTMSVEGHRARDGEDMQAFTNAVSPGYWQTMGLRLLQGRDFNELDRFDAEEKPRIPTVAIVNRAFAEYFFGKQSAVGRYIAFGDKPATRLNIRIIGVVENSLYESPRFGVRRQVFFSYLQFTRPMPVSFYVRGARQPAALFPELRRVVTKFDASLPVYNMKLLSAELDDTLSTERLIALLSAVFGALATLLASVGLYGVTAFLVARRTREIGLRIALGAQRRAVLWLVLREVLFLLGSGLLVGLPVAYLLSRYVSSQLFGVAPSDGPTTVGAVATLLAVAAASGFLPARRAMATDPLTALRYE